MESPKYRHGVRGSLWMDEQSSRRGGRVSAPEELPTSTSPALCSWHLSAWLAPLPLGISAVCSGKSFRTPLGSFMDSPRQSSDKKSGLGILRAKSQMTLACPVMLASHKPSLNLCRCSLNKNKNSSSAHEKADGVS